MGPATVIFLHGFASSAQGTKARYLRRRLGQRADVTFHAFDFNPTPLDFEYLTTSGMINRLRQYLLEREQAPLYLVGSSLGGLVALNYAHRFQGVAGLLLLAPVLAFPPGGLGPGSVPGQEGGVRTVYHYAFQRRLPLRADIELDGQLYRLPPPPSAPTVIVHGRQDQIVPLAGSRCYADRYPQQVELVAVEATHTGLNGQLETVWQALTALIAGEGCIGGGTPGNR